MTLPRAQASRVMSPRRSLLVAGVAAPALLGGLLVALQLDGAAAAAAFAAGTWLAAVTAAFLVLVLRTLDAVRRVEEIPGTVEDSTRTQLRHHTEQVQALVNLFQLVPFRSAAPPLGGWAASAEVMLRVVDEMIRSRPKVVVECGSGSSTVWLALVVREFQLPTRIVALEHKARFARATRRQLDQHGVAEHAEVRLAKLAPFEGIPGHTTPWYDTAAVQDMSDIGILFVDGPPGTTGKHARLPAVPVLRDRLAETCTIVLDDLNRAEERAVADHWRDLLDDFDAEVLRGDKGALVLTRSPKP